MPCSNGHKTAWRMHRVVSLPTIKRLEAKPGNLGGRSETGDKIRAALEAAGVIFVEENGEGPGVRLRKVTKGPEDLSRALDRQIVEQEKIVAEMSEPDGPSPEAGMAAMDKALAENELVDLKNKRTRRKGARHT